MTAAEEYEVSVITCDEDALYEQSYNELTEITRLVSASVASEHELDDALLGRIANLVQSAAENISTLHPVAHALEETLIRADSVSEAEALAGPREDLRRILHRAATEVRPSENLRSGLSSAYDMYFAAS